MNSSLDEQAGGAPENKRAERQLQNNAVVSATHCTQSIARYIHTRICFVAVHAIEAQRQGLKVDSYFAFGRRPHFNFFCISNNGAT